MKRTLPRILSAVVLLVLAVGVVWAAVSIQTALVPSGSMEPELKAGDLLLVRKDAYRNGRTPARGDIVLFEQQGASDYFVKRVVGLSGETVFVLSGWVAINNTYLDEPYTKQQNVGEVPLLVKLEHDEYFLMGDNRAFSEDSRDVGPVRLESIRGKVTSIIAPRARRGNITNPFTE